MPLVASEPFHCAGSNPLPWPGPARSYHSATLAYLTLLLCRPARSSRGTCAAQSPGSMHSRRGPPGCRQPRPPPGLARQKHRADTQVAALRGQLQKKGQQAARLKLQVAGLNSQLQASQQQAEARAAAFEAQLQGQQQLLGAFKAQLQEVASRQRAEGDLPQLWAAKLEAHEARMLEVRSMPSCCRQL